MSGIYFSESGNEMKYVIKICNVHNCGMKKMLSHYALN